MVYVQMREIARDWVGLCRIASRDCFEDAIAFFIA